MRLKKIVCLFLCAAFLHSHAFAFETDQYNLPPAPLADIGAEVSEYAAENLTIAVDMLNAEIVARQNCLGNVKPAKTNCGSPEKEREKLAALRSDDAIARAVFNRLGAGFPPFTKSGSWMEKHQFKAKPARYKASFRESIFSIIPTNYLTVSSTVNLYGSEFGTDKIAHVFQQGFTYYSIYKRALAKKATEVEAVERAVDWGKSTENTYYGFLVSGVYSNADLCANFVGLKFYLNLTHDVKIGIQTKPAILTIENGVWTLNKDSDSQRENFLRPFISNHLNEARNPSLFVVGLRSNVRRTVKNRSCKLWRTRFPDESKIDFENETNWLTTWNGEDYGHKRSGKFITIANSCFDEITTPSS